MKKIIVPIDGSEYSKIAMEKAKDFAKAFDSKIVLLYVIDIQISGAVRYELLHMSEEIKDIALNYAEELTASTKEYFKDMPDKIEIVKLNGNPAEKIIDYINESDADLVIMGSHGLGAVTRFFIGSVTNKVLHNISKPLMIVR